MIKNKISAAVTPEKESEAMKLIEALKAIFFFLVDLTRIERIRLAKLSPRRQDFLDKTLIHAEQNPTILPQYTSLEEFRKDVDLTKCLQRVFAALSPFTEMLNDTLMVIQAEAYETARAFYNSAKEADKHGVDGTEQIIADLSYHFKRRPSSKKKKDENNSGGDTGNSDSDTGNPGNNTSDNNTEENG